MILVFLFIVPFYKFCLSFLLTSFFFNLQLHTSDENGKLVLEDETHSGSRDQPVQDDDEPDLSEKGAVTKKSKPVPVGEKASPDSTIM